MPHEALRIANATEELDFYMEQPCETYDECLTVRRNVKTPVILDECVYDVNSIVKAHADKAADIISIKISKFGRISKSKQVLC